MNVSLEECFQKILKEIALSPIDRKSYNEDAVVIRNELMERMKTSNRDFKCAFRGLSLTGSYLDSLKIDLPDEFDLHIKLEMPFSICPYEDVTRPGYLRLTVQGKIQHPIVRKRRINRNCLQAWIHNIFKFVIGDQLLLSVNGRNYKIEHKKFLTAYGVAHTVVAMSACGREISFDFVPVFEFRPDQWPFKSVFPHEGRTWFAVPFGKCLYSRREPSNKYTFMPCAPHWEANVLHNKMNLKNSLRLMKAIRNSNKLGRLTSYMLKSVYLEQIDKREPDFWKETTGVILIEMLEVLLTSIKSGYLPFFLNKGVNHLNLIPKSVIKEYGSKLEKVLNQLKNFQKQIQLNYANVKSLFI